MSASWEPGRDPSPPAIKLVLLPPLSPSDPRSNTQAQVAMPNGALDQQGRAPLARNTIPMPTSGPVGQQPGASGVPMPAAEPGASMPMPHPKVSPLNRPAGIRRCRCGLTRPRPRRATRSRGCAAAAGSRGAWAVGSGAGAGSADGAGAGGPMGERAAAQECGGVAPPGEALHAVHLHGGCVAHGDAVEHAGGPRAHRVGDVRCRGAPGAMRCTGGGC